MSTEIDTSNGGEALSLDEAAAAYVKATTTEEADPGQSDDVEETESDETTDDELQASDEDEGEETDGETDDEEGQADEEEDETEPETERGRYVAHNGRVKLPDGSESTISDLIQGNLRDRDYRQKTMELAELRKSTEAQSAAAKASDEQLTQQRDYVIALVKSILPQQPDPSKADPRSPNYDPAGYQAEKVAFEQWAGHLNHLEAEQQRIQQERQAKADEESKGKVQKEWETALEKLPELKDAKRLEAFGKDTVKFGAEYGYTPREIANIHHDHRQLLVIKDAIAWRKLQASKASVAKKVEGRPPVTRSGKRLNPAEAKARSASDALTRLQETGSERDAVAAYLALQKG